MAAGCCVLVDSVPYIDDDTNSSTNDSTAQTFTSTGNQIVVSLWPAHPPIPSRLSVHCNKRTMHPGQEFLREPKILCAADGFFLLRVAIGRGPPPMNITHKMCDYFVYQPASSTGGGPSLRHLAHPHPHLFGDNEVAVLPRAGGHHFTVAALSQSSYFKLALYLFKSEDWRWTSKKVLVDPPQIPFPMPLPPGRRHFRHLTNSVITIGGGRGTVGWVDLWHGILLYDVLRDSGNEDDDAKVRLVPLPVRPGSHGGKALDCCPKPYRSVAVVGGCLKLVELETFGDRLPGKDPETGGPRIRIDDWALTTYSTNCDITGNPPEDWKIDFTVNASAIQIDTTMRSALVRCGMLLRKSEAAAERRNLQNLWTYQPVLSLNDDEGTVVYLITRVKFRHPKAWLLAVDMANNQVRAMAMIETERSTASSLNYVPCRISSPAT